MKNKSQQLTAIQYKLTSHNKTFPQSLNIYFSENALNLPLINVYYPRIAHAIRCRIIDTLLKQEVIPHLEKLHYALHSARYLVYKATWLTENNTITTCELTLSDGSMIQTIKLNVDELFSKPLPTDNKVLIHSDSETYEPAVLTRDSMEPWPDIYKMDKLLSEQINNGSVKASRQLLKMMTIERFIHPTPLNEKQLYDAKQLFEKLANELPISNEAVEQAYATYLQAIEVYHELLDDSLSDAYASAMRRLTTDGDINDPYELFTLRHQLLADTLEIQQRIYSALSDTYHIKPRSPQHYTAFEKLLTALLQQQLGIIEELNKFESFNTAFEEYDLLDKQSLIAKAKLIYALQLGLKQCYLYFSQEDYIARHNPIKQSACLGIIEQRANDFINVQEDGFKFTDPEILFQQFSLQEIMRFTNSMMDKFLIGNSRSTTAREILKQALKNQGLSISDRIVTLNDTLAVDAMAPSCEKSLLLTISNIQLGKLEKAEVSTVQLQTISARINNKLRSIKHDLENQYQTQQCANKLETLSKMSEMSNLTNDTVKKYLIEAANLRRKIDKLDNHEHLLTACNQIIQRFKKMYHASADFVIKQVKALNEEIEKNFSALETERSNLLTLLAQAPSSQADLSAFELKLHEWTNLIDAWQRQINRLQIQLNDAKETFSHSKELKHLKFEHDAHHFHETIANCQHQLVEIKCTHQLNAMLSFIEEILDNNAFWHQQVSYFGSKYPARNANQMQRVPYHIAEMAKIVQGNKTPLEKIQAIVDMMRNLKPNRQRKPATAKLYQQLAAIKLDNHEQVLLFNLEDFVMNLRSIVTPSIPQESQKQSAAQFARPSLVKT